MRQVSKKKARENRLHAPIRAAVFERDGWTCRLRGVPGAGRCWGGPTPHHRRKDGQGGGYTLENLVTLCVHHNGQLEADADLARLARVLGLVILRADLIPNERNDPMTDEQIAHVVHEANRAVQIVQGDPTIPVSPHWEELDDETAASATDGVRGVRAGNTPEESHENWCRFKIEHGWTLGPVKDEAKKEHPLLVPYAELPEAQQIKDHLFGAIVTALAG